MSTKSTIDIAPVRQWFEVFTSLGAERDVLLNCLNCPESLLYERDARISTDRHHAMLEKGVKRVGIPGIALRAGIKTQPENMGVVGQMMMNCASIMDAGRQIVRYASLLCDGLEWTVSVDDTSCDIRYRVVNSEEYSVIGAEASLASCVGMLNFLSNHPVEPLYVGVSHSDPGYSDVYSEVFGLSVSFNQPECLVRIAASVAQRPIRKHQPYVLELLEKHAADLLSKLENSGQMTSRVQRRVVESLASGEVDIETISRQLAMSRWTLTRRLKDEGTNFNRLLKRMRSDLAQEYLNDHSLSITEVSFLLGYSEPRAFQRAFRSWYQCSPSEFRSRS